MDALAVLAMGYKKLPPEDHKFCESLVKQAKTRTLSPKQMMWVEKFAKRCSGQEEEALQVQLPDFAGVNALFDAAKKHLKWPKIRLQLSDTQPIGLSRNSKGMVNVTDGRPYGQNVFYGKITPEGVWEPTQAVTEAVADPLAHLLLSLAQKPAETVAAYGKMTGNCSFCASALTDPRSVAVGYGRVCAQHFSLPWG